MSYVMTLVSAAAGGVATLGLPDEHWAVKVTMVIGPILVALGYQNSRGKAKGVVKLMMFCLFLGLVAGCKGMIPVKDSS